ncbi:sub1p [Saccharomyces arboricola H-6]|uniref:Sub1p n=1 Tax=Saccharomyces arboricola (strain H-6 / AS 2.3317 / CBS 10644) TaxID=1160507 RepID=J8LK55_SACAR|nr:sub1p [Saccharomyces arboricola H-6]
MSYYNRYRNKRRGDNGGGNLNGNGNNNNGGMPSGLSASDAIFDLGKNKRVTVRQFRNINLIDIREYYLDSSTGEMKPGKKGISLTEDLYDELLKHRLNIDEALRRLGSKRPKTKMIRLLSDDEYEDDNNNDNNSNDKDKNGNDKNSPRKRREDKSKSSNENHDSEPRSKKKKPAPPTLLPHEENIQNAEREANATLIIPGQAGRKQQEERKQKEKEEEVEKAKAVAAAKAEAEAKLNAKKNVPEPEPAPVLQAQKEDATSNIDEAKEANSSDEEFAQSLEAEMNKADDDISEEE